MSDPALPDGASQAGQAPTTTTPMLCERLAAAGVPHQMIPAYVPRNIYPWHLRMWWRLRLSCGADPFTAEHELVTDLLAARTWVDVNDALYYYYSAAAAQRTLFMRPSTNRVKRFARGLLGPQV